MICPYCRGELVAPLPLTRDVSHVCDDCGLPFKWVKPPPPTLKIAPDSSDCLENRGWRYYRQPRKDVL